MKELLHLRPILAGNRIFQCISFGNPVSKRFEPSRGLLGLSGDFRLQFDFLGNQRIFEFAEFLEVQGAVCERGVHPFDLGDQCGMFSAETHQVVARRDGALVFPRFDFREEFLPPGFGNDEEADISKHLGFERFGANVFTTLATLPLSLVGAAVVKEATAAFLHVDFATDAVAAVTAPGEIEEGQTLVASTIARLGEGNPRPLHLVESGFRNHRQVSSLMELTLEAKDAVVKWIGEELVDRGQRQSLAALVSNEPRFRHLPLNGGEGKSTGGKQLQDSLYDLKFGRIRFDGAELGLVKIPEGGFAGKHPAANFFAIPTTDIHREIADILIGHAEFDGDQKHVVGGKVSSLKGADLGDDPSLKESDDFASVIEVARKAIQFPC